MAKKILPMVENQQKDDNYWQGFKDLHNDPEFIEAKKHEFIHGASEAPDIDSLSSMSRRRFLALMGASAALAGAACTPYQDKGKIIPYVNGKEGLLPGIPNYYSSTYKHGGESYGILVKTREGRPIKINGNPDHPVNKGKIPSHVQANILELYDPIRLRNPQRQKKSDLAFFQNIYEELSWKEVDEDLIAIFNKAVEDNKEIAVIGHSNSSPTGKKVFKEFSDKYPTTKFYNYELFDNRPRLSAWQKCYGNSSIPLLDFSKVNVIVSFDGDFLGTDKNSYSYIRDFSARRDAVNKAEFNRLYLVETGFSQTAISADYRLRLSADKYQNFLMALASDLLEKTSYSNIPDQIKNMVRNFDLSTFIKDNDLSASVMKTMSEDILREKDNAIFYAGDQQSEEVHILVNMINEILGSNKHYKADMTQNGSDQLADIQSFRTLVENLNADKVDVVIHVDANPVYHLPIGLGYEEAIKKAGNVLSLALAENETVKHSNYILPLHHTLESWGDDSPFNTVYSLQQPVIEPLYNTRQAEAMFLVWSRKEADSYTDKLYHDYMKTNWNKTIFPENANKLSFNKFWYASLHDGIVVTKDNNTSLPRFNFNSFSAIGKAKENSGIALMFKPSYTLGDGKYANNGWLQEIPHPVSKITWDNYAAVSFGTAKKLGVDNNDLIKIDSNGKQIKMPVFIQPGMADNAIVMEMGYGRKIAGPVGTNVGFDVNILRPDIEEVSPWIVFNANVSKVDGTYELMSTQEHYVIDFEQKGELIKKRHLILEASLEEYAKNPNITKDKRHHVFSITDDWEYKGNKWGMAIDLTKCIGCSACVTSCNIENNIPVVGKDQVAVGREMHWMRIDRYYSGKPEDPKISVQPMLCQHCDNAPCENVCPVAATVHSPDGLNDMAYNRCVGTRYCANNCPYKVRRFNFFNYRDHVANGYYEADTLGLLANPEVTVRSRGVMEKCSFCVQRISEEKDDARKDRRDVDGSRVVTACQEACPSDAIVFGDINQETGELRQYRDHNLGFHVLEEINVKPNVTYITKLRNTHTEDQA